jgi:hypothetical protein
MRLKKKRRNGRDHFSALFAALLLFPLASIALHRSHPSRSLSRIVSQWCPHCSLACRHGPPSESAVHGQGEEVHMRDVRQGSHTRMPALQSHLLLCEGQTCKRQLSERVARASTGRCTHPAVLCHCLLHSLRFIPLCFCVYRSIKVWIGLEFMKRFVNCSVLFARCVRPWARRTSDSVAT